MPSYANRCAEHGDWMEWRSIHDDAKPLCPECGQVASVVMVPPLISIDALPNRSPDAKRQIALDHQWEKDLPAYKALRKDGLQPRGIDGCHQIEAQATDSLEVSMGRKIPADKRNLALEANQEIKENQRQGNAGSKVGEVYRKMKRPRPIAVAT